MLGQLQRSFQFRHSCLRVMKTRLLGLLCILGYAQCGLPNKDSKWPLNIAHRGSKQGADYIECDVVITSDLELVCSHEPWISETSNVADHTGKISGVPHTDFSDRLKTYNMNDDDLGFDWNDKGDVTDYFTFDFTLKEIMELRRKQTKPNRDSQFDWKYSFVTFDEFIDIAKSFNAGIYPEIKQPSAINRVEDIILRKLSEHGYDSELSKVFIQCFELSTIKSLQSKTPMKRIFLVKREPKFTESLWEELSDNGIYDSNDPGLIRFVERERIETIHSYGLKAHLYTFRNEWTDIPWDFGKDPYKEYEEYVRIGIDGFFTDFPATLANFKKNVHINGWKGFNGKGGGNTSKIL
ncbi:E3.1.4.46 [Lepeophtheirus salmonis]|uniref:glycerophosphodiester phosphodiesterase n=1 Tax=Lepeophtheirus salmonis TaxID=72036 RepID=A0A7R8H9Z2_LEPSM|nr:E3.1.4.46 [Lepeophtheirus salmonis]CAF2965211.1 E3.1.4.46 [Lepeophtheirus salmonis]